MAFVEVMQGRPVQVRQPAIDVTRSTFQLLTNMLIGLYVRTRRRRNLDELDSATMLRVSVQERFVRLEPLDQALGIIQPVHADDLLAIDVRGAPHGLASAFVGLGERLDLIRDHADGIHPGAEILTIRGQAPIGLKDSPHFAGHVVLEGEPIRFRLEADEVVKAKCFQQLIVRWNDGQDFRRRERNVKEETDAVADAELAASFGEGNQVIVVDPNDVVRFEQRFQFLRQHRVDPSVTFVLLPVVPRQVDPVVKDRPQRGIGKSTVILVVILLGEAHRGVGDIANCLGTGLRGAAYIAIPAKPDTAGLAQCVVNANCKPASSDLPRLDRRYTVGNHY